MNPIFRLAVTVTILAVWECVIHRESRDGSGVRDLRPGMVGATRSDREPRAHIQRPESSETGAGSTMRVDLITVPQVGVYTIDVNAVKRNVFIKKRND